MFRIKNKGQNVEIKKKTLTLHTDYNHLFPFFYRQTIMKVYRSRISLTLVIFILLVCYVPALFSPKDGMVPYLVAVTIVAGCILLCFCGIKYVIDDDVLKVYSFWGIHEDIKISSITKIEKSRCLLSSPAASWDRLAIHYNKHDVVYISPRNQEDFLDEIETQQKGTKG